MTLPTTEALREARGRLLIWEDNIERNGFTPEGFVFDDLGTLLTAADLLLSEEWQGMVEAAKEWVTADDDAETPQDYIEIQSRVMSAAISLGRKLAAQEKIK